MIAAWWNARAPEERRILSIGAFAAVLMLGWALVWHPLAQRKAELEQTIEGQRSDLAYVRAGAGEIERLRATGTHARADRSGRSLLALADATARNGGIEAKRVEPVGTRSVRVSFEGIGFDALATWIELLSRSYGIEATDLSADRADGIGLVNARVTLQDAP